MALGFDLLCGELLAERKKRRSPAARRLHPLRRPERSVPPCRKAAYDALLGSCDERVVLHERYETGCMFERNRYMVDRCDLLFAYLREGSKKAGRIIRCGMPNGKRNPYFICKREGSY